MDHLFYRNSLQLFSKIVHLFSFTKNLDKEQWQIVKYDLLSVFVRDIALFWENKYTVRYIDLANELILVDSKGACRTPITGDGCREMKSEGSLFTLHGNEALFIDHPYSNFTEEEKMVLNHLVDHLKISQDWRESLEVGFETQKRINLLHKITVSIRGSLDLSEVLGRTANDLGDSLKTSRCFIRRYDPLDQGRVLATEREYTMPGVMKAADLIFDFETDWMKSINADLTSEEQFPEYLHIKDVNKLDDPTGLIDSLAGEIDLVTFLAVPLLYKGSILGCICFHQCGEAREFSNSELGFIQQVADEATGAILHAEMYQQIQTAAHTDSLTGLYNKSSFYEAMDQEIERVKRSEGPLSIMMLDMDYLKRANDTFGHIVGDEMIILLGTKLKQTLRQIDIIARFGGDEFGIILPGTDLEGAKLLAERVVEVVLETQHPLAGNLSLSVGISGTPFNPVDKDILIEEADKALYLAKKRGKGTMCASDDAEIKDMLQA